MICCSEAALGRRPMSGDMESKGSKYIRDTIDAAEEFVDPLYGLAEKTNQDPGAPFTAEMLVRLAALKIEDRPRFEALRAQLKRAGCRVTALDAAIAEKAGHRGSEPKQTDILLELAAPAEPFHAPDETAYADIAVEGHRQTWPVRSKRFLHWLTREFLNQTGGAPSIAALRSVLNVLEAKALEGPERRVYTRVGSVDGRLYLDLCDKAWKVVEITKDGWKVIDNPPLRFCRPTGMRPIPDPMPGGSVDTLRRYLNLQSDADFVLVVAWALAVLRDRGPYPVLVLSGEHGSAKSSFTAILRELLDPRTPPFRAFPREDRDLFIAANNSHLLAFDNISSIPSWISDTLCRLATGGGFAVRRLYADLDEVLFDATRPLILNGIEDNVSRPDLADRAVMLNLGIIPDEHRRPEAELWRAFDADKPLILGALLDAVAEGLRRLPDVKLQKLPRMADFAMWAVACETAWRAPGTFLSAYDQNLYKAVEDVVEGDHVAAAVRTMMAKRATQTPWAGTATDLLDALAKIAGDSVVKSRDWPKSPRALSNSLRRVEPVLRKVGIEIEHSRSGGRMRARLIEITARENSSNSDSDQKQPSASSASSALPFYGNGINRFNQTTRRIVEAAAGKADAGESLKGSTVRARSLTCRDTDDADATDAKCAAQSGPKNDNDPGWSTEI